MGAEVSCPRPAPVSPKHGYSIEHGRNLSQRWRTLYDSNQQGSQRRERRYCSDSRGTASEQVIKVLECMPEELLNRVEEVTLDMADSMRKIVCRCFPKALRGIVKLILKYYLCLKKVMDCPRCGSLNYRKDGFVKSRQRYECKEYRYHYIIAKKSDVKSAETRHKALEMYLEGLDFRATGRLLPISYGTVYAWVKAWGLKWICPGRKKGLNVWNSMRCIRMWFQKKTVINIGNSLLSFRNNNFNDL
ncbi:hypothetical protein EZS27_034636, partial [termite gut metagenome]